MLYLRALYAVGFFVVLLCDTLRLNRYLSFVILIRVWKIRERKVLWPVQGRRKTTKYSVKVANVPSVI